jgi:hypothetical protein
MMTDLEKMLQALDSIDPSRVTYEEWIHVGMAIKAEGLSCDVWDDWSRNDSRYHVGECDKKWSSFENSGISAGTIFHLAEQYGGYTPSKKWSFDDYLPAEAEEGNYYEEVLSKNSAEEEPWQMAVRYLETLFTPDESVSYVHSATFKEDKVKWIPADAGHVRNVSAIIRDLKKYKRLDEAFGTINPEAGAWIRHNPSTGAKDADVTRFAYVLVESDSMPLEEQKKFLINQKLPIVALIESGGKSIHAIVKIEASDENEFKQRTSFLFDYLSQRHFQIDEANKNPARLSRLPGAMRNGNIQRLLATNIGCASWLEWIDLVSGVDDDLPEIHSARDMFENPVPEPPAIIDGVLRKGAKMICTGDSKSGKTCLLMNLAICIAEGWEWLGHQCMQGRVLYINMEVMQSDFETRYKSIYKAYKKPASEEGQNNFDWWNLRGKAEPLDKLAPKIIRRCRSKKYLAIIVDPIYKVQGGDENSAEAIGKFCALFDQIAEETGASMIYVHHHAKGSAGGKKVMDRGSGSGVFSRDADAIIDFASLVLDPNEKELLGALTGKLDEKPIPLRLEMVLRSFRSPDPLDLFFEFPLHVVDTSGLLKNAAVEGSPEANRMQSPNSQRSDSDKKEIVDMCFKAVVRSDGRAKFSDMYQSPLCKVADRTLKRYILMFPEDYKLENGYVTRVLE